MNTAIQIKENDKVIPLKELERLDDKHQKQKHKDMFEELNNDVKETKEKLKNCDKEETEEIKNELIAFEERKELFKRKQKPDYEVTETKKKNTYSVTLNKRYLFNKNKINGCIFYFSYKHSIHRQKDYIKDLLYNNQIKSFNKVVESYYKVRDKLKQHYKQSNKKSMRKDNRKLKVIAIKKVLRYFKNKPLKAEEIRLILNLFFDFNIGVNRFSIPNLHNAIKEITQTKVKTTTKEKKQQQYLKNNLFMDLRDLNAKVIKYSNGKREAGIKLFNKRAVIKQHKGNIATLKAINKNDSENINKQIEHLKQKIATLRKTKITLPLSEIEKVKDRSFNKSFVVYKNAYMDYKRELIKGYVYGGCVK